MDGLFVLLVLGIILVPIIIISMLSGIKDALESLQNEQREMRLQIKLIANERAAYERERRAAMQSTPKKSPEAKPADVGDAARKPAAKETPAIQKKEPDTKLPVSGLPTTDSPGKKSTADVGKFAAMEGAAKAAAAEEVDAEVEKAAKSQQAALAKSAAPERTSSVFEETVEGVLTKIWNWILVGEEHRSTKVTAEYAIASVWLLRVGIIAVVTGIGFFLKLSIQRGWVGEEMRTVMSAVAGVVMIVAGLRMVGKKYHILGQGFLGGGIAVLYFSAYAASLMYGIVPDWAGFLLMAVVTLSAGVLSVKTDSMMVAVLGIIGGYVSPFFFDRGAIVLPLLYAYLLILSLGILGVAYRKQWRLLNYLALGFTYSAFLFSLRDYRAADHFGFTITYLSLYFVVHSAVIFVFHLSKGQRTTGLEIFHLFANAAIFSLTGYWLIHDAVGSSYPAVMSVALSLYCLAHLAVFIRRKVVDPKLMISLIGLAGAFALWTFPILFDGSSLTVGLSLFGLAVVWMGQKMGSRTVDSLGHVIFSIVLFRLFVLEIPLGFDRANASLAEYWSGFKERAWPFGVALGSLAGACFLWNKPVSVAASMRPEEGNDIEEWAQSNEVANVFYWIALAFGFLVCQLEVNTLFQHFETFRLPALSVLWCLLGGFLLLQSRGREGHSAVSYTFLVTIVVWVVSVKLLFVDLPSWDLFGLRYSNGQPTSHVLARLLDFGVILATLFCVWRLLPGKAMATFRGFAGSIGLVVLFIYLNLELRTFLHLRLPGFEAGGISILWSLFAIALVVSGILKGVRGLRIAGLALFGVTVAKVFLGDLSGMDIVFRVVAAVVVGMVLLLGSFAYIHSSARFKQADAK